MADTNCTPLECPALPRVTLDQAVIDLLESIALQESALSHILCAESQKMKTAMAMEEVDLCKLLEINDSATNMVMPSPIWSLCSRRSWSLSPTTFITPLPRTAPAPPPRNNGGCPCLSASFAGQAFLFVAIS